MKKLFGFNLVTAFVSLLCGQASNGVAQESGLVGHWPLNGNINDATGRHTQSLVGSSFVWTSGAGNEVDGTNALAFNPQNQADTYVEVTNAADLQFGTNDFTVSYWVKKLVSTTNYYDAYGIGRWDTGANPGQNSWTLLLDSGANNDQPEFVIECGTSTYFVSSPTNLTLNVWHHLVGLKHQSALNLYVDGVFTAFSVVSAGAKVNDNSGLDFYIGASANPGYGADAIYDDVQIYKGALSGGGIAYLYNHPGQTVGPIEPSAGLVAWWPANSNAVDVVGGNNGTLTNGVNYTAGEVDQTFNFSSNSALVLVSNTPSLQLQNFTIEAWIKRSSLTSVSSDPTAVNNNALLFGYGHLGYSFGIGSDGRVLLTQVDVSDVVSRDPITDTFWHHVAVTTTNGTVVFYLDGIAYPYGNYNVTYAFNTQVAIGGRADNLNQNNNDSFLGAIDELSVYSRALSATEIQSIYYAGNFGKNLGDYTNSQPHLAITRFRSSVVISWPAFWTGYSLQQNTNLSISGGWTASTNSVTTVDGTNGITFTPMTGDLFFRLAYP